MKKFYFNEQFHGFENLIFKNKNGIKCLTSN